MSRTIRVFQRHEFTIRNEICESGGEGKVSAATLHTWNDGPIACAAKEQHLFASPDLYDLSPEDLERYVNMARRQINGWAAMTPHPNVLSLIGVSLGAVVLRYRKPTVTVQDVPVLLFSPLYATNVKQWLKQHGRAMTDEDLAAKIASIAICVLRGLTHIHAFGIVHRDIKCDNIFCNETATDVVVGDFGLIAHDAFASISGSVQGNPIHMAPEIGSVSSSATTKNPFFSSSPRSVFSVKADVWSFAMLLLEMLLLARDDQLEGVVCNRFARRVVFDPVLHRADDDDTRLKQQQLRAVVNGAVEKYPPVLRDLFTLVTRLEHHDGSPTGNLEAPSSLMEVALQLDRRLRGSMEHCLVLMELQESKKRVSALEAEVARLSAQLATATTGEAARSGTVVVMVDISWTTETLQGFVATTQTNRAAASSESSLVVRLTNTTLTTKIPSLSCVLASESTVSPISALLRPSQVTLDSTMGCLKEIGEYFLRGTSSMVEIDLSPLTKVTRIAAGFLADCATLRRIDLGPFSHSLLRVGDYFLSRCVGIQDVDLSPLRLVQTLGYGFMNECTGLVRVDLTALASVAEVGGWLMDGCSGLRQVTVSSKLRRAVKDSGETVFEMVE